MNNPTSTEKLIQLFLKYLNSRDLENLTQLFGEEIDWYIPGNEKLAPWLGKRGNRKEIKEFYELLWKNTEPISATISHIMIDNENAIISGEFATNMLKTNKVVESLFFISISVENNLITKYRLLEDSYAVSASLIESE